MGEVVEVNDPDILRNLDILEGVELGHYERKKIDVESNTGLLFSVWSYLAHPKQVGLVSGYRKVIPIEDILIWEG